MVQTAGIWSTLELLVKVGCNPDRSAQSFDDELEEWLENLVNKMKLQIKNEGLFSAIKKTKRDVIAQIFHNRSIRESRYMKYCFFFFFY